MKSGSIRFEVQACVKDPASSLNHVLLLQHDRPSAGLDVRGKNLLPKESQCMKKDGFWLKVLELSTHTEAMEMLAKWRTHRPGDWCSSGDAILH
jgi:hypothetical protein